MKPSTVLVLMTLAASTIFTSCGPKSNAPANDFLVRNLDTTVSPAKDFFRYANGGWLKANPIPPSERMWGVGNLVQEKIYTQMKDVCEQAAADTTAQKGSIRQKIGDFYATVMDSNRTESLGSSPLKPELDRIASINNIQDLRNVLALYQTYRISPLFFPSVDQDEKNSSVYSYHLYQGGLGLPNRDYYFRTDQRTQNIRSEYLKHVAKMLTLLGEDPASAGKHSESIMALETRLAKASRKLEDLRDPYRNYNKMSVAQLGRLTPALDWKSLLPAMSISKIDSVVVGQPEFYKEVQQELTTVPMDEWKEYLRWNLVNRFSSTLDSALANEHFHFYGTVLSGVKEQRPRWKRALDAEERAIGDLLGQQYVAQYVPAAMRARYEEVVKNMFASYADRIKKLDWMSEETKTKALAKLEAVRKKVCYPDKWKDYSSLEFDRSSYFANQLRANQWLYQYFVQKLGKPVDRTEWDMTPQTYNAYYNPSNNEIVLPAAGLLIPDLADSLADDALIYGYAGASTIGHEVTHGFDDEGRQFDAEGNLRNWWSKDDEKQFNQRAQKMVDQFDAYIVLDSLHVNGKACLGENIADLGGVVIGYDAFKHTKEGQTDTLIDGLTPDQRFFLAYAYSWLGQKRDAALQQQILTDVHSPEFLRVNGPLSNVPEFYHAFGVKPGDPMWRPDSLRVKIW